jgi:arabinan endo-1,5-alpha-L-arabinosidase
MKSGLLEGTAGALAILLVLLPLAGEAEPVADAAPAQADPEAVRHLYARQIFAHDPSTILRYKNEYWFFSTGVGINSRRSKDLVNWEPGPRPLPEMPGWVRDVVPNHRGHYWAPDLIRIEDRFLLYYSVSSWGRNDSAIALLTNTSLDPDDPNYRWTDEGIVFRSYSTNNFNAIDPGLIRDVDGRLWMSFGSFWSGIKMIELDPATGKRIAPDSPIHSLAYHQAIEAARIHHYDGYYYLFLNWGRCCRGVESTYNIRIGRSRQITGPYLDKEGVDMLKGGGTLFLETTGRFIGPGHAGIFSGNGANWFTFHFYDAEREGRPTYGMARLEWGPDGWPGVIGN